MWPYNNLLGGWNKRMQKIILVIIFSVLVGCSGVQTLPEEATADAKLYRQKCTLCHGLPSPSRHTRLEWKHYLILMESHMENRGIAFPDEEKTIIQGYLDRNAS
jgi:hypothetical protein